MRKYIPELPSFASSISLRQMLHHVAAYNSGRNGDFRVDWSTEYDMVGAGGVMSTVEDLLLWVLFTNATFNSPSHIRNSLDDSKSSLRKTENVRTKDLSLSFKRHERFILEIGRN